MSKIGWPLFSTAFQSHNGCQRKHGCTAYSVHNSFGPNHGLPWEFPGESIGSAVIPRWSSISLGSWPKPSSCKASWCPTWSNVLGWRRRRPVPWPWQCWWKGVYERGISTIHCNSCGCIHHRGRGGSPWMGLVEAPLRESSGVLDFAWEGVIGQKAKEPWLCIREDTLQCPTDHMAGLRGDQLEIPKVNSLHSTFGLHFAPAKLWSQECQPSQT